MPDNIVSATLFQVIKFYKFLYFIFSYYYNQLNLNNRHKFQYQTMLEKPKNESGTSYVIDITREEGIN